MAKPVRFALKGLLAGLLALSVPACHKGDPKTAKYWVDKIAEDRTTSEKKSDLEHLGALLKSTKEPGAAAQVAALLKEQNGDLRARAAEILGELGDKSAIPALGEAIDTSRGAGEDKATKEANRANKAIADALGKLGDKSATPALTKLLKCKDVYAQMAAIDALGSLRDPNAVDELNKIATDTTAEPLVSKKAIMALGSISDPKAIPAIRQMLYKERKGISFFPESSFALYQIGKPSAEILMKDVKGADTEFVKWAKENGVVEGAIHAKSAQILGDLAVPAAEQALLSQLSYKDPDQRMELVTRMQAADALGRMRSKAAVKPIGELSAEPDSNARATYDRALTFIGDRAAVPALLKSASGPKAGPLASRQFSYKAIALIGSEGDLKAYDEAVKGEDKAIQAECKDSEVGDAECAEIIKKNQGTLAEYRAALTTGCKEADLACWQGKLNDKSAYVRQRAALELGRSLKPEVVPALFAAVQKPLEGSSVEEMTESDNARFDAILGLHWILDSGSKVPNAGELADKLDKQVDEERKKAATQRSAEDVKRLAVKMRRAAG